MTVDHYATLRVNRSASVDEIKRAYRRCALQCHPDHNGGSCEEFQRLQEAYVVLSDPVARKLYDAETSWRWCAGSGAAACFRRADTSPAPPRAPPEGPRPPPRRRPSAPPQPPPSDGAPPPPPRRRAQGGGGHSSDDFHFTWPEPRRRIIRSYPLRDSDVKELHEQMKRDLWAASFVGAAGPVLNGFQSAERVCQRHAAAVAQQRLREEEAGDMLEQLRCFQGGGHIGADRL
eukprot:TRINITY_DN45465_c0_g1_i1.p1 TRINITY_DN45465_c0_g1~~TRINITY_DN45465_c0_g1_i1.p1  ORF type:complete len:232 (+),score=67.51 TRINITY_DN45465_c0_g1_i1:95-790(+)